MVADRLVDIAFRAMRIGAHEVDERQLEARLAGVRHQLDGLAEIGDGLVRLAHALVRNRPQIIGLRELRGWISLGIAPITYVQRIREVVLPTDLWELLIKAPVFGLIISMAG